MSDCLICDRPLEGWPNDNYRHDVCLAQARERTSKGICEMCGNKPIAPGYTFWCDNCSVDSKYTNYPGPQ